MRECGGVCVCVLRTHILTHHTDLQRLLTSLCVKKRSPQNQFSALPASILPLLLGAKAMFMCVCVCVCVCGGGGASAVLMKIALPWQQPPSVTLARDACGRPLLHPST